jgi:hypothetical protein
MRDDMADFTVEIADQVESFVLAVREIAAGDNPDSAISMLLLEVSQLLLAGGRLGAITDVVPEERFEPDAGYEPDVEALRSSLRNLLEPIDDYHEVFDPIAEPLKVTASRMSDDLAEVISNLVHGLQHYRAGRPSEALWWWQFSYLSHWGSLASGVLRVLISVVSHVRLDEVAEDVKDIQDRALVDGPSGPVG